MKRLLYSIVILFIFIGNLAGQTDTEFWFAVPEVTWKHNDAYDNVNNYRTAAGYTLISQTCTPAVYDSWGTCSVTRRNNTTLVVQTSNFTVQDMTELTYLHLSALGTSAKVTIEMPRESSFTTITVNLAANSTQRIDLTPYIRTNYADGVRIGSPNDNNILESGLPSHEGLVENRGIHITSTNYITAYLERNNTNNPDIWALKGTNAFGSEFFVPSQNFTYNQSMTPIAINAIDIVATEDVDVYVYPLVTIKNVGTGDANYAKEYVFHMLKGQSLSLVANGRNATDHLGGTKIITDKNLPKSQRRKIIVQWKDDSVRSDIDGCYDLSGDQLVPTDYAGKNYIVMRGKLGLSNNNSEYAFIMATQANTAVTYTCVGGTTHPTPFTLTKPGEITRVKLNTGLLLATETTDNIDALYISANKPVVVFHVTGFGCEMGAAILPTIDGCTGSTEVSFRRSTSEGFFLNIMCKKAHIDDFFIDIDNGTTITTYPIPVGWFTEIPGTGSVTDPTNTWWFLNQSNNEFTAAHGGIPAVPVGRVTRVFNTTGLFHLGLINGGPGSGCRYGYFSDFSNNFGSAVISNSESDYYKYCYGDTINLQSSGGISYNWQYVSGPATGNTFLDPLTISSPRVLPPPNFNQYAVTITRVCYIGTPDTTIQVAAYGYPEIKAQFDLVKPCDCSPIDISMNNTSVGANKYEWTYEKSDGTTETSTNFTPGTIQYLNNGNTVENYDINLKVSYTNNCPDTAKKTLTVRPSVNLSGSITKTGCQEYVNASITATSTNWAVIKHITVKWGDGTEETFHAPGFGPTHPVYNHLYTNITDVDKTYYAKAYAYDDLYICHDSTDALSTFVVGVARANFSISDSAGCSPHLVHFDNTSSGTVSYDWDFGDGSPHQFTKDVADVTYHNTTTAPKPFNITLKVTRSGCTDQITKPITVYPEFTTSITTPNPLQGCNPLDIDFNSTLSNSVPDITYVWDYGDGSGASGSNPTVKRFEHPFNTDQNYTVTLTAKSKYNCSATNTKLVTVYAYNEAKFTVLPSAELCSPATFTIKNVTASNAGVVSSAWTDDVVPFTPANNTEFNRLYTLTGTSTSETHTITLTNQNSHGCPETYSVDLKVKPEITANFSPNKLIICDSTELTFTNTSIYTATSTRPETFDWDFGDGASAQTNTGQNSVTHRFRNTTTNNSLQTYQVTLTAWGNGCSNSKTIDIQVRPRIKAQFSTASFSVCTPQTVTLTNLSSGANNYDWIFSDGTPTSHSASIVQYAITNNTTDNIQYPTVRLVAVNGECQSEVTKVFTVYPELKPLITADVTSGCSPLTVKLQNQSDGETSIVWDFNDGTPTTSITPSSVTFYNSRPDNTSITLLPKLTISNAAGCSAWDTIPITIFPMVKSSFDYVKSTECSPMNITLKNSSFNGNTFKWDFEGMGAVDKSTKDDFSWPFSNTSADGNSISTCNIKLVTIDGTHPQCRDSITKQVKIYPEVKALFDTANATGCSPLTVNFTNNSKGYNLTYSWDYGDGSAISAISDANYDREFDNRSNSYDPYIITLKVTDPNSCTNSITKKVFAHPHVIAGFAYQKLDKCTPYPIRFSYPQTAINGNKFIWNFNGGSNNVTKVDKTTFDAIFDNPELNTVKDYAVNLYSIDTTTQCHHDTTVNIRVYPQLKPAFTQDTTQGCNPLPVQFTNQTTGLATYLWDFGDSQSSAATDPLHTFSHYELTDQNYTVNLKTVQNVTGCTKNVNNNIKVYSYVHAKFGILDANPEEAKGNKAENLLGGCTPFVVIIKDSSRVNTSTGQWSWDFGNGTSSERQPGNRTFTNLANTYPLNPQPYIIKLRVTNQQGCYHDTSQNIEVYARSIPDFNADLAGCHPWPVKFTNNSVVDTKTQYFWDLGSGGTSVVATPPEITYYNYSNISPKSFDVWLTTTTQYGCADAIKKTVTVYPKPLASFQPKEDRACPPFNATLVNKSNGTNLTYHWNFGNDSTVITTSKADQHPKYENNSIAPVTLNVELIAVSSLGCSDTMINPMVTFPNVIVNFDFEREGCSPHTVHLKNKSTITSAIHQWRFGDGSTSVAKEPEYTYFNTSDNDKIYQITYVGTSRYGCVDSLTQPVTVYISPAVDFLANDPVQRYPDDTVYFQNLTQPGPWTFLWDFGDGHTSDRKDQLFLYKYGKWGSNNVDNIFHVTLKSWTEHCAKEITRDVKILPPFPFIKIDNQQPAGCVPLTIPFSVSEEYCNTYLWEFSDGFTANEAEPIHEFTVPGIYNVKLTATGDGGEYYDYKIVDVYPLPVPQFTTIPTYPDVAMLPDQPVQFFNASKNAVLFNWDFGDGGFSTDLNPVHQYTKEGIYTVKLVAWSEHQCMDSIIRVDSVIISGEGNIEFPNAFLPTANSPTDGTYPEPDNLNLVFHPKHYGIKDYDLWIFNRWGEQIFHTTNILEGWNGRYGNTGAELGQDVYFWKSKGTYQNNVPFKKAGDVTLIRK